MRTLKLLALAATALAAPAMATSYTYGSQVSVPGFPLNIFPGAGPASMFPISITVSGARPVLTDIDLVLSGLRHTYADDIAVAVQAPTGLAMLVLTDAGGSSNFRGTYTFSDGFAPLQNGTTPIRTRTSCPAPMAHPSMASTRSPTCSPTAAPSRSSTASTRTAPGRSGSGTMRPATWARSRASRSTSPPVPEPATWAMMIGGLGLVGASMRRRKTAVSFA